MVSLGTGHKAEREAEVKFPVPRVACSYLLAALVSLNGEVTVKSLILAESRILYPQENPNIRSVCALGH